MPLNNLGRTHLTTAQKTSIDTALTSVETILLAIVPNFTEEERTRYGSVDEKNKLLVNSVRDYSQGQPDLASPDVNWVEYEADFQDRAFCDSREKRLTNIVKLLTDFKISHDYDNYKDALVDYDYCQYKARTNTPGFVEKAADLKQFFPNTGGGTKIL